MRRLEDEARGEANLLPAIIEAVAAYATVGEISDRLRAVVGRPPRADHRLRRRAPMPASPGSPSACPTTIRSLGRVHHVAVVVADIDDALGFWRDMLGLPVELVLPIESDGVTIAFLPVGESKVELVMPTDDTTGVARFLASKGEGFHHVCFEVDNLAETLHAPRARRPGAHRHARPARGRRARSRSSIPRSCHGVLVELIEAPGGPAWAALGYEAA